MLVSIKKLAAIDLTEKYRESVSRLGPLLCRDLSA